MCRLMLTKGRIELKVSMDIHVSAWFCRYFRSEVGATEILDSDFGASVRAMLVVLFTTLPDNVVILPTAVRRCIRECTVIAQ